MKRSMLARLDERGIKLVLAAFFLALAVPSVVLIAQAYSQLKWSAFRSTQLAAEDLATRIDATLRAAVAAEDARSFGEYSFLVVEGDAAANFVQRSPLSTFPVASAVPGLLGYFQVDAAGTLTTPLLPATGVDAATYGIAPDEAAARAESERQLREVLARNRLVRGVRDDAALDTARNQPEAERDADAGAFSQRLSDAETRAADPASGVRAGAAREESVGRARGLVAPPSAAAPAAEAVQVQAAFDELRRNAPLAAVAVDDSAAPIANEAPAQRVANAAVRRDAAANAAADERQKRIEQTLVPEPAAPAAVASNDGPPKLELAVRTFESELDPIEVGVLDTGHLVLFRNAWRAGQRYIQGALVDRAVLVAAAVAEPYRASSLAGVSRLTFTHQGRTLDTLSAAPVEYVSAAPDLKGTLLHRARLSPPFGDFELAFVVDALPRAPGTALLTWVAVTLAVVLCGGFFAMYRFAAGQLRLARQQQDFVSAVSHELKTPLTSIRMYGEMLKAGWADDAKKRVYYDYIHSESERLSRLIDNVLQLARLTRSTPRLDLKPASVAELMDMVRSKVATQIERAGFTLAVRNDVPADTVALVDADGFAQIFINLVDNAIKFSAGATTKAVEIASRRESDGGVLFTVRDFGPGVPKAQMKKIFELFYRPESELTRETAGTGIGLALVRQLATAMGASVDVRNREPGAEFRLRWPPSAS